MADAGAAFDPTKLFDAISDNKDFNETRICNDIRRLSKDQLLTLKSNNDQTLPFFAVSYARAEVLRVILLHFLATDVFVQKPTAISGLLNHAIQQSYQDVINVILEVDLRLEYLDPFSPEGNDHWCTLHHAAIRGYVNVLTSLEGKATRPRLVRELTDKMDATGRIALHLAAFHGKIDMIKKLLDLDPCLSKIGDNGGDTPLHLLVKSRGFYTVEQKMEAIILMVDKSPSSLSTLNATGQSPYMLGQQSSQQLKSIRAAVISRPHLKRTLSQTQSNRTQDMSQGQSVETLLLDLTFNKIDSREKLREAVFGKGKHDGPELHLELTFIRSSDSLSNYLDDLRHLNVPFYPHLASVELPDIPCSPGSECVGLQRIASIFDFLRNPAKGKAVAQIHKVVVADCIKHSHSELSIKNMLSNLDIRYLDWRKADISLALLQEIAPKLNHVHLYTSGHLDILSHWTGYNGLYRLPYLRSVHITILKGSVNFDTLENMQEDIKTRLLNLKKHSHSLKLEIPMVSLDDFPLILPETLARSHEPGLESCQCVTSDLPPRFLSVAVDFEDDLKAVRENSKLPPTKTGSSSTIFNNLQPKLQFFQKTNDIINYVSQLTPIKVAVLDSGTSTFAFKSDTINGATFVEGSATFDRYWHSPSNQHGTMVAWLIKEMNSYCDIYSGKMYTGVDNHGVDVSAALEGIKWAIDKGVDIICMSWTVSQASARNQDIVRKLKECIQKAAAPEKKILMFCSTRDKPYKTGDLVLPAELTQTFAISSCDFTSGEPVQKGEKSITNFYFPGQEIDVPLPKYLASSGSEKTAGSSFATALAAGLASLILTFARFSGEKLEDYKDYDTMKKIFQSMCREKESDNDKYVRPWEHFPEHLDLEPDIEVVKLRIRKFLRKKANFGN